MPGSSFTPETISNILLFDPFNLNNHVPTDFRCMLTVDEFFNSCYYFPDESGREKELTELTEEGLEDIDSPISQMAMRQAYNDQQDAMKRFLEWIEYNDRGIYCIVGDAGTGKSTYVRYLERTQKDYRWIILDLAAATRMVRFFHQELTIANFGELIGKAVSTLLRKISDIFFDTYSRSSTSSVEDTPFQRYKERIARYLEQWYQLPQGSRCTTRKEISTIFSELANIKPTQDAAVFCQACGDILYDNFNSCNKPNSSVKALHIALEFILILLYLADSSQKKILVFDNIERFIGTDEIYDNAIVAFANQLRSFSDSRRDQYFRIPFYNFQIVLAIRNCTVRMFTPQQISDNLPHSIDISTWFSAAKIIQKKLAWIESKTSLLNDEIALVTLTSRLNRILSDRGKCGESVRGLNIMLAPLFNHNKRLMVSYLTEILAAPENEEALACAENILDALDEASPALIALKKHAYRSIIWRLICDKLRADNTFLEFAQEYQGERDRNRRDAYIASNLNYARQILTILNNNDDPTSFPNGLSLPELLCRLYPNHRANIKSYFFDSNVRSSIWDKLAGVLFTLNTMSRHDNYWFRYINVQCNDNAINASHISTANIFKNQLFREALWDKINIKITATGKAFLFYVSHTFEQFSSFYFNYPPLYTQVPTENDLLTTEVVSLPCAKIIMAVSEKRKCICSELQANNDNNILYYSQQYRSGIPHWKRIENAYNGYVSNFVSYINLCYQGNSDVSGKIDELSRVLLETCKPKPVESSLSSTK